MSIRVTHRASIVDRKLAFPYTEEEGVDVTREYARAKTGEYSFGPVSPDYDSRSCQVTRGVSNSGDSLENRIKNPEFERFTIKEDGVTISVRVNWKKNGSIVPESQRVARVTAYRKGKRRKRHKIPLEGFGSIHLWSYVNQMLGKC